MKCISTNQSDAIPVVDEGSELGDIADIVTCSEEDVFALRVFRELALNCSQRWRNSKRIIRGESCEGSIEVNLSNRTG